MAFKKFWQALGFGDSEKEYIEEEQYYETEEEDDYFFPAQRENISNLVALRNDKSDKSKINVVVIEPSNFEEAPIIADNLKDRRPVIINMENADPALVRRMIDFIGGVCYAIGGTMQKIGYKIILVVPPNINISGELRDAYIQQDQEEVFAWVTHFDKED